MAKHYYNLNGEARQQIASLLGSADSRVSGQVENTRTSANGDFSANHALTSAKKLGLNPKELAGDITQKIELNGTYFSEVSSAGPGFLNFTAGDNWYSAVIEAIEAAGEDYGSVTDGNGERVMVEFVSANPTGPMTIGNARGGALGDSLANVLSRAGYDVWREFYVNDAGNQVNLFGRSIDARYMQLVYGEKKVPFPENGYHGADIRDLAQIVYDEKGDDLMKLEEDARIEYFIDFALPRNIALMKEHLSRYRISYDKWFHESELHESGYVAETVELLKNAGLTYEKEGALWLNNTSLGADKDEVLLRTNGFYTYYAADIAYHRDKFEKRGFDRVIDVLGADHHGHVIRFRSTVNAPVLGYDDKRLTFLVMQMVRLTRDGETVKVSKRTGRALTLNDLLDEISVDACRFFFNAKPENHLEFDLGLAVRQDSENPVYYAQYAHARICTLISAAIAEGQAIVPAAQIDASLLNTQSEHELIKALASLPDMISASAKALDPSEINRYILDLAAKFHKFYNDCRIRGEAQAVTEARLKLCDETRLVLAICLKMIGVTAPERM